MENIQFKADFLKNKYVARLGEVDSNSERRWGKMNVQQMVEHMSYSFRIANGREPHQLVTAEEIVPKMQAFLMSDKPFKENTPNSLLADEPLNPKYEKIEDSLNELQDEISYFFEVFERNVSKTVMNPFFGALNFDMWVQLLYKHAWHHLRQFGVEERQNQTS